jgi:hypothetical protein
MPVHRKGEMFDAPGVHIVTANSFISDDGTLVMSMGASLAMKTRFPEISRTFGAMIKGYCGHLGRYGLMLYGNKGILQTRCDIQGRMEPELIKYGLKILYSIAEGSPLLAYHLAHPGVSLSKMSIPEIDRLLESLPKNVCIWQKE